MRALTLTQPWAGLVAAGVKLVENRPRPIMKADAVGKRFAIHASREIDEGVYATIRRCAPDVAGEAAHDTIFGAGSTWYQLSRITSAVIGVATLRGWLAVGGCTDEAIAKAVDATGLLNQARFAFGPMIYLLEDVRALETPVPARGYQGFWTLAPELAAKVEAQLGG